MPKSFKVAKSEADIIAHAESRGSCDCALKGFRQGKPVLLCTPASDVKEVVAFVKNPLRKPQRVLGDF